MKKLLPAVLAVFLGLNLFSQTYQIGVYGGVASYNGDLTEKAFNPTAINGSGGIYAALNLNEYFVLRGGFTYARLRGSDANNDNPVLRNRNLSFRNDILEFGVYTEFNFMELNYYYNSFTPYLFTGIAGFYQNPQAQYEGHWVDLQPLGTEGQGTTAFPQRKPYGLTQIAIPFGAGVKILVGDNLVIGAEGGFRKTFTDYIDDVSKTYADPAILEAEKGRQAVELSNRSLEGKAVTKSTRRGNPGSMDAYWFAGVKIAIRFGSGSKHAFLRVQNHSNEREITAGKF